VTVNRSPLVCELHAHTTWSDGELSVRELVELYGAAGFDVVCVTDHVLRRDDQWPIRHGRACVTATNVGAYLDEIEREGARALSDYGLLLVAGLELTYNDPDPNQACHAVALGLHGVVSMDDGPVAAMEAARSLGAAVLVAHPHRPSSTFSVRAPTCYFARRWQRLRGLFDRVELFNGGQLFSWVAAEGLAPVACGDLHRAEQLPGWTTVIPCEQDAEALVDYLRSSRPVSLTRLGETKALLAA
jgi:PHP domain